MAIKTQSELVTQSNNTFLDNTTGQIIPTNHRQWNNDVLETMFEGIAGRVVTKAEFDDLLANSELIVGTTYFIVAYPIGGNVFGTLQVKAISANEVLITSMVDFFDTGHVLKNDNDSNSAKIVKSFGSGFAISSIGSMIANELATGTFGLGAELNLYITDTSYPYRILTGRTSADTLNTLLEHNLYAQNVAKQSYLKGFLPQEAPNSGANFYPDHGCQNTWGTANISNAGEDGFLLVDNIAATSNITILWANFQKVNTMVFGMLMVDLTLTFGGSTPEVEFDLPYLGYGTNWQFSIIGHGNAVDQSGANHTIFASVINNGAIQRARIVFTIIGNHTGNIDVSMIVSFSYSLDPS
jgi:hypothetical protein